MTLVETALLTLGSYWAVRPIFRDHRVPVIVAPAAVVADVPLVTFDHQGLC